MVGTSETGPGRRWAGLAAWSAGCCAHVLLRRGCKGSGCNSPSTAPQRVRCCALARRLAPASYHPLTLNPESPQAYLMFGNRTHLQWASESYAALLTHSAVGAPLSVSPWLLDVHMSTALLLHTGVWSLSAYWPGFQALAGAPWREGEVQGWGCAKGRGALTQRKDFREGMRPGCWVSNLPLPQSLSTSQGSCISHV